MRIRCGHRFHFFFHRSVVIFCCHCIDFHKFYSEKRTRRPQQIDRERETTLFPHRTHFICTIALAVALFSFTKRKSSIYFTAHYDKVLVNDEEESTAEKSIRFSYEIQFAQLQYDYCLMQLFSLNTIAVMQWIFGDYIKLCANCHNRR